MTRSHLKLWLIVSFTFTVIAIVIRSIWQIVVIPTTGTMVIFIPLILALLGANALFAYLTVNPHKLKSLPVLIGITLVLTAGLVAGIIHFARYIPSPEAAPLLSKIIGSFVMLSCAGGYSLIIWVIWFVWKPTQRSTISAKQS